MTVDPWDVFAEAFPTPPEPERPPRATVAPAGTGTGYGAAALDAEVQRVLTAPRGTRNHALNRAAYSLGQLVAGGVLDEATVVDSLRSAGSSIGLAEQEMVGVHGSGGTIYSGLNSGKTEPRGVPEQEAADPIQAFIAEAPRGVDPETGEVQSDEQVLSAYVREKLPVLDWHALWADDSEEEWIVEPLLPARRLVALYSAPKVGKSLLLLELCVAICMGRPVLGVEVDRPRKVLYVDFENDPKADVRERLQAMGVGPDDLANLHYLSFPSLTALDSPRGGVELMAAVTEYACEVVVIDTVSRSIQGEENENDTWLAFYRHTGLRLKQAGVALIRLDHAGKDESKGQRGGSAKSGDVDAVWRMSRLTDDSYRLDCEAARMPVVEKTLVLHREQGPLRHRVDPQGRNAAHEVKVEAAIRALDKAGVAHDVGRPAAATALRGMGLKAGTKVLSDVVRRRSANPVRPVPEAPGQVTSGHLSPVVGDSAGQRGTADA